MNIIMNNKSEHYINPYLGGFLLGLVLLSAYYIGGHGLGASGAVKNFVIALTNSLVPEYASGNSFFRDVSDNIWRTWIVIMFIGVLTGGFISGAMSSRLKLTVERGPRVKPYLRLILAFCGGMLFGIGAQLGRGCTSGAALSGMAVLSASGIITMLAIFGTGFGMAFLFRKFWL
jgi:uncharacterized membrane protein YedE/YeeE